MTTPIHEYPPCEQKYVAVRRFKITITPELFKRLLERLELTEKQFAEEYGEELIGNPALFNQEIADIVTKDFRRVRNHE